MPNKTFPNNRRKTSYTRPCSECVCRPEDAEEKIVTLSLIYFHTTCLRCGNLPFYKIVSLRVREGEYFHRTKSVCKDSDDKYPGPVFIEVTCVAYG